MFLKYPSEKQIQGNWTQCGSDAPAIGKGETHTFECNLIGTKIRLKRECNSCRMHIREMKVFSNQAAWASCAIHKIAPRFIAGYLRLNLSKGAGLWWQSIGNTSRGGGVKKKRHVQPSNRAWGWLQPSDKSHNHPHSQYTTCTVLRSWKAARSETGVQCRHGLGYRLWLANGYALDSYRVDRCWQLTSDGRTCMVHPVHTQCYTLQTCQRLVSFCAMHAAKTEPGLEAKKARGHGFEGLWMVTSEIKISYIVT